MDPSLVARTQAWIESDVDANDAAELQSLLATAQAGELHAASELSERMGAMPEFGTAGIRGPLRAGPNGMNRQVIARITAGLATWLRRQHADTAGNVVVVGRDGRYRSESFTRDVAGLLAAAGFDVRVLPEPLPTPVLAHCTRRLSALAGIQLTASHNPAGDHGYKVFDQQGRQLASPADAEIQAAIAAGSAHADTRIAPQQAPQWTIQADALPAYLTRLHALPRGSQRELRIAMTALHGVGGEPLRTALQQAGFQDVHVVPEQFEPDPAFSTVKFPNPEEPGATDRLLELAQMVKADIALALDPDADRCAVGLPVDDQPGAASSGASQGKHGWRMLTGNEVGGLLAERILSTRDSAATRPMVATTVVSSSLLQALAEQWGAESVETLTGFKWLMRAGENRDTPLVFAYEEALGYCVDPEHVADKDGISAALLLCDWAAELRCSPATPVRGPVRGSLHHALNALALRHGVHLTHPISARLSDTAERVELIARLRQNPPTELAGVPVTLEQLDSGRVLRFIGENLRVAVRPSGTEPKLKCYLETREMVSHTAGATGRASARELARPLEPAEFAELAHARERAEATLSALRDAVKAILGLR